MKLTNQQREQSQLGNTANDGESSDRDRNLSLQDCIELGDTLLTNNQLEEALDIYKKIIERKPNHISGRAKIAGILLQQAKYQEALVVYKKIIDLPNLPAWVYAKYAQILDLNGYTEDAIKAVQKSIELEPDNSVFKFGLARLYIKHGDSLGQAIKTQLENLILLYQEAIKLRPDSPNIYTFPSISPFKVQQNLLKNNFKKNSISPLIIFDVGANNGGLAQGYSSHFPDAIIHCFEPTPETFQLLEKRLAAANNFKFHQLALSDRVGTVKFHLHGKGDVWNSILPKSENLGPRESNCIEVKTTTIDRFCSDHEIEKIDILKLDIQGGELLALNGARGLLEKGVIDLIYTEVHFGSPFYENEGLFQDIASFLHEFDYFIYDIYNMKYAYGSLFEADCIFTSPLLKNSLKS